MKVLGDRYDVGALLGHGGMADVHAGIDTRLSRPVAIKTLRSDLARDRSFQTRFRREAQAAAALNHPNIVSVFDTGEEELPWGKVPYIVMEYVEGQTLRDVLRNGDRLSTDRAIEITQEVLAALDYSHRQGLIHRDIKPGNIMLTPDGVVKVMDFGIARALDDVNTTVTHTSSVIGTAAYLSPEQARGDSTDARSDIYAVGCLLYELLTGRTPFIGDSPVAVAYQHAREDATPPSSITPGITSDLDSVVMTALAKNPDNRYQSAAAMSQDLQRIRDGVKVAAAPLLSDRTAMIPSAPRSRSKAVNALLIAILIASLGLLGFLVGRTFLTSSGSGPLAVVPDVRGLTEADARNALTDFDVKVSTAPDPLIPAGRVSSQTPSARSRASAGSTVTLIVSEGIGKTTVPLGLIGKTLDDARALLQSVGLSISRTVPVDSDLPAGSVVSVSPDMGSNVDVGTAITLNVASGKVTVPNVKGKAEVDAVTILTQSGFKPQVINAYDASQPVGVVLSQAPDPGTSQAIGSTVTITVNKSP